MIENAWVYLGAFHDVPVRLHEHGKQEDGYAGYFEGAKVDMEELVTRGFPTVEVWVENYLAKTLLGCKWYYVDEYNREYDRYIAHLTWQSEESPDA